LPSDRCLSLPDLTQSSVKQLLAASLRCDSDMRCSALMSETQCTQTQTQQSSIELFDTGVIRTKFYFCVIQTQEQFTSDTSICLAVMLSTWINVPIFLLCSDVVNYYFLFITVFFKSML
jgi:hypothetical protein